MTILVKRTSNRGHRQLEEKNNIVTKTSFEKKLFCSSNKIIFFIKMEIKILFAVFLIASTLVVAESCMGSKKGQNSGGKYSSNAIVVLVAK